MTAPPSPVVAQTLHGYRDGHRLLAGYGDLSRAELVLLERASDLSGYLPQGASFEAYESGYQCGRYYAFASSWRDGQSRRAGTVLTHTLLVRPSFLATADPWSAGLRHVRPDDLDDLRAYMREPEVLRSAEAPLDIPEQDQRALLFVWFCTPQLPVFWANGPLTPELVRWLWPRRGTSAPLSFCMLALQPPNGEGARFDFLAVPDFARGAFSSLTRSPGWWDAKAPRHDLDGFRWIEALRGADAKWWSEGAELCAAYGLPLPDRTAIPPFVQLRSLLAKPDSDLVSTRASMDLVEQVWPAATTKNTLAVERLASLIEHQAEAPLSPKPLRAVTDLLTRAKRLLPLDEALTTRLVEVTRRELEHRLDAEIDAEELSDLLTAARGTPAWPVVVAAIARGCGAAADPLERPWLILRTAAGSPAKAILAYVLAQPTRHRALWELAEPDPALHSVSMSAAVALRSPWLALLAARALGDERNGLAWALDFTPSSDVDERARILDAASPGARVAWALDALAHFSDEDLAAQVLADVLLSATPEAAREVLAQLPAAGADHVWRRLCHDAPSSWPLWGEGPEAIERVARDELRRETPDADVVRAALDHLPAERVFTMNDAAHALDEWSRAFRAHNRAPDAIAALFLARWLRDPAVAPQSSLARPGLPGPLRDLSGAVWSTALAAPGTVAPPTIVWLDLLGPRALDDTFTPVLLRLLDAATDFWAHWASALTRWSGTDVEVARRALDGVRRQCKSPDVVRVIAWAFPRAWPSFARREHWWETSERAQWRRWLVDTWVERAWPARDFLDALPADSRDRRKLIEALADVWPTHPVQQEVAALIEDVDLKKRLTRR